ncbi:thioesterase family protein [Antrihabitans cavernicola]|uniref:Thioesterase family protein n=2 Tax=Antrihabitans cavernicola TaxID=2495913 RepID=A0A5A7SBZ3_9NOCA|nr:thioesterase family protein [Spelaeibacter cavernicola]
MITGPATCGIVARELENAFGTADFVPARLTVDLFRAGMMSETTVTTTSVRDGRRIKVADASVLQGGVEIARATLVLLRTSEEPPGEVWVPDDRPIPPNAEPSTEPGFWWGSDDHPDGWTQSMRAQHNAGRKRMWGRQIGVVSGEEPSQFVRCAMAAESTSLMSNWGTLGVGFINADMTMALARLPIGPDIGLEADNHISTAGVAVGSATLFDRHGSFGSCVITAVANPQAQVTFG